MRFLHTADWHLGRLFHGSCLTEDQAHVMEQFVALVKDEKPDAVLVCGDVYDRAVPPADAVRLLDDVLSRLVLDLRVPVIMIAGNHDSPDRLAFGSRVLAGQRLHVFGSVAHNVQCVTLYDKWGPVRIYALPYAEPAVARAILEAEEVLTHEAALNACLERIRSEHPSEARSVALAHAFVSGGEASESERPLSVGGADRVSPDSFEGIHYVALGHLHRPQTVGSERLCYSGSLLKYSFSEAAHSKCVALVEIGRNGQCEIQRIPLTPKRELRRIEGYLKDILEGPRPGENRYDYIAVSLLDTEAILDVMGKLRQIYPNVLHVERPFFDMLMERTQDRTDHRRLSDLDLFSSFFRQVTGKDVTADQKSAYESVVGGLRLREREVSA